MSRLPPGSKPQVADARTGDLLLMASGAAMVLRRRRTSYL
jgi:hypothetical protein